MNIEFPRVDISEHVDIKPGEVEALQEIISEADAAEAHLSSQRAGMYLAFMRLKKPIARRVPAKRAKPTKHVVLKRRLAARSTKRSAA